MSAPERRTTMATPLKKSDSSQAGTCALTEINHSRLYDLISECKGRHFSGPDQIFYGKKDSHIFYH